MRTYVIVVVIAFIASCKQKGVKKDPKILHKAMKLDSLYSDLFTKEAFNGNVLVAEKGTIIFEKSYGLADEKTKRKLNSKSVFELASVSKQFTAIGIVLLEKEGKLNYNDKISTYIPELSFYEGITIKNLLTHTGGLPDYMDLAEVYWDKSKIATNKDIIQLFVKHKPKVVFAPNEKFEYSNTGYLLLGTIIEQVSGVSFEEFLKQKIFDPIEMNATSIYRRRYQPKFIENYANGYVYSDSLKRKMLPDELGKEHWAVFLDGIVGDGMVNSTIIDLLKWDRALYTDVLVNQDDKQKIFSFYKTNDNVQTKYGFGWFIKNTEDNEKTVYHSGGWAGYITYIERNLTQDKTIIILQNNMTPKTALPVKKTRAVLYN